MRDWAFVVVSLVERVIGLEKQLREITSEASGSFSTELIFAFCSAMDG